MTSDKILSHGVKIAALIAIGLWAEPSRAAQMDCGAMADSLNPGDAYVFKLEIQSKMVRIEKGEDFCAEPAKDWFKRQLILPPPARETMPVPKKASQQPKAKPGASDDTPLPGQQMRQAPLPDLGLGLGSDGGAAPLPIQREFVKPKKTEETPQSEIQQAPADAPMPEVQPGDVPAEQPPAGAEESPVYGVVAPPPPEMDDSLVKRCDRTLESFWSPGEHIIEGRKFWLSGVFTIDLNSDGRVDDVGFKIKAEGRIGNILNYFPASEGRLSGKTVDSLKLEDDRDINRLCPGNITFERPGVAPGSKKERPASQVKVLGEGKTGESAEEETPEEEPIEEEPPKKEIKPIVFIVGGIAMILLLAGGIGLAFAIRNMTSSKDDEYEYYEEEEEDD